MVAPPSGDASSSIFDQEMYMKVTIPNISEQAKHQQVNLFVVIMNHRCYDISLLCASPDFGVWGTGLQPYIEYRCCTPFEACSGSTIVLCKLLSTKVGFIHEAC